MDIGNAIPIMENASGQTGPQGVKQQQKSRAVSKTSGSICGGNGKSFGTPSCPGGEKAWLVDKKFRLAASCQSTTAFHHQGEVACQEPCLCHHSWSQRSC